MQFNDFYPIWSRDPARDMQFSDFFPIWSRDPADASGDLALALELELCENEARDRENARSLQALGGVTCEEESYVSDRGRVLINGEWHEVQDFGAAAGGHVNMCFYLSVAAAEGRRSRADLERRALDLKTELSRAANQMAAELGTCESYDGQEAAADFPVVYAAVTALRRPVLIYNAHCPMWRVGPLLRFSAPGCSGRPLALYYDGSHYQAYLPCFPGK